VAAFFVSFDGYVMVLALPAIASDFQASVPALADLGSIFGAGTIVGLPIAMLADQQGRRRLLAIAVAAFSLANLASAAAPGLWWLAGIRAGAVTFETVAASIATALVVEEVEARWRGLAVAGLAVAAGAGLGLTTVLYPLVAPHWRWLYLVGSSGLIAALVLARWLPESRTWAAAPHERLPIAVLLRPPWRGRLLPLAVSAALGAILYEPAGLLVALFGSQRLGLGPPLISAVVVVSGLAAVPAFVVGGRLSDQWGRRSLAVGLSLATAVFAALLGRQHRLDRPRQRQCPGGRRLGRGAVPHPRPRHLRGRDRAGRRGGWRCGAAAGGHTAAADRPGAQRGARSLRRGGRCGAAAAPARDRGRTASDVGAEACLALIRDGGVPHPHPADCQRSVAVARA
jgi:predicted MFS family arabinose efflux permease